MVIPPAMTIRGLLTILYPPGCHSRAFLLSFRQQASTARGPSFLARFIAHLKYLQMMKEQAGGDPRHEILQCNRNLSLDVESLLGIPQALMMDMLT
jgi:hypothetical protein